MRELKECREEIFRRSENRIKEQKKKCRRTFVYCVSFCVLFIVWSVSILGTIRLANENYCYSGNDSAQGQINGSVSLWIQVEIQQNKQQADNDVIITNTQNVALIYDKIQMWYESNLLTGSGDEETTKENVRDEITNESTNESNREYDVLITFTAQNGERFIFEWNGNLLFDRSRNREILLKEEQLLELKTILGLE